MVTLACECVSDHGLSLFQHQQQVMGAIERAKQVTPPEMNSIIRVSPQSLLTAISVLASGQ